MPRFAANLTFLFNEVLFLDRFGEAAHAGFRAVEFAFPYEYQPREIVERQREHKVDIEPLNRVDNPGYFLSTQAEAHAIREAVGAPNLKVQMDLYHAQIVEGNLAYKLRRWVDHIGHIQIAGVPGRTEPDVGELNYAYL